MKTALAGIAHYTDCVAHFRDRRKHAVFESRPVNAVHRARTADRRRLRSIVSPASAAKVESDPEILSTSGLPHVALGIRWAPGPSLLVTSVVLVARYTEADLRNECADPLWARKIENIWLTFSEVTTNVYFATARSSGVRTFPVETRADLRFIEMICDGAVSTQRTRQAPERVGRSPGSEPPSQADARTLQHLYTGASAGSSMDLPAVVPTADGGVQLEWHA